MSNKFILYVDSILGTIAHSVWFLTYRTDLFNRRDGRLRGDVSRRSPRYAVVRSRGILFHKTPTALLASLPTFTSFSTVFIRQRVSVSLLHQDYLLFFCNLSFLCCERQEKNTFYPDLYVYNSSNYQTYLLV